MITTALLSTMTMLAGKYFINFFFFNFIDCFFLSSLSNKDDQLPGGIPADQNHQLMTSGKFKTFNIM
jgi:hypothetical protein